MKLFLANIYMLLHDKVDKTNYVQTYYRKTGKEIFSAWKQYNICKKCEAESHLRTNEAAF